MLGRNAKADEQETDDTRGFDAYDVSLGDMMRGERATLGKSLLDVQRELKIKAAYIAAVENADPSVFETPGFIAGYVRSYAQYLGLDPAKAYARFCEESGFAGVEGLSSATSNKPKTMAKPRVVGEDAIANPFASYAVQGDSFLSRIEPGAIGSVAVLLALIVGIGYGGYAVLEEIQRVEFAPVDDGPGVVAEIEPFGEGPSSTVSADVGTVFTAPSADALDRLYRPQALEAPVLTARDGPIAAIDPGSIGSFIEAPVERLAVTRLTPEPELPEALGPPAPPQVIAAPEPDVVLFAVRPAWVRVANADGSVLFEKILDTGETYVLPKTDTAPVLRAGNSGSLYFRVQGDVYGPAGNGTSVAKNVALSVAAITENYTAPEEDATLSDVLEAMATQPLLLDEDVPIIE